MQLSELPTNQLAGAILVAVVVAVTKYVADVHSSRRANRLRRLDAQLEHLYGPLFACSHAAEEAWNGFRSIHRAGKGAFWQLPGDPPSADEAEAWRRWMISVFMPLNERMETAVITHAHLLEENEMPVELLDLCAHVEVYRGVIAQWSAGDFSRHWSSVNYPDGLSEYARKQFVILKKRHAELVRAGA